MKTGILCNGGNKIGLGHIMRTMVIAKKLLSYGEVFYITTDNQAYEGGRKIIQENNFNYIYDYDDYNVDILIVDQYNITSSYLTSLKKKCKKLVYIDDMNELDFYDVDIIINRNIGADKLHYNTADNCKLLLGTKYCILGENFVKSDTIKINKEIKNILITFGGSDPTNTTPIILEYLKDINCKLITVIGSSFSNYNVDLIEKKAKENKSIVLYYSPDMSKLMSLCDIAITACGGTVFELSAMGIPSIAVIVADNQETGGYKGHKYGLFTLYGHQRELKKHKFNTMIKEFINNFEQRKAMSSNQKELVNKNGIDEIIKEIVN